MGYIDENGKWRRGRNMRTQLRQVSAVRLVGFQDAVDDLGTHTIHGVQVPYTHQQVRKVLQGKHKSERLLRVIANKRPDLFTVYFVCDDVRKWAAEHKKEEA